MFQVITDIAASTPRLASLRSCTSHLKKSAWWASRLRLYEAAVTVCGGVTNILAGEHMWQWHKRLCHCINDVLKATGPHVRCIEESNAGRGDSKRENCILGKSTTAPRNLREGRDYGVQEPTD